jgi:hypothetical protein
MEIRRLTENDFKQFSALVIDMYKEVDATINEFQALNMLMHEVHGHDDFMAFGWFNDKKLVGMSYGRKFNKKSFYFSGIYVIIRNNEGLKKLIDFSFATIKDSGYTSWLADASNPNIQSILQRYDVAVKFIQYEGKL